MSKVTYLDDLQQMQADHIWGKVSKMRKQKYAAKPRRARISPTFGTEAFALSHTPYYKYRSKVAAQFAGRAAKVAHKLISLEDY